MGYNLLHIHASSIETITLHRSTLCRVQCIIICSIFWEEVQETVDMMPNSASLVALSAYSLPFESMCRATIQCRLPIVDCDSRAWTPLLMSSITSWCHICRSAEVMLVTADLQSERCFGSFACQCRTQEPVWMQRALCDSSCFLKAVVAEDESLAAQSRQVANNCCTTSTWVPKCRSIFNDDRLFVWNPIKEYQHELFNTIALCSTVLCRL